MNTATKHRTFFILSLFAFVLIIVGGIFLLNTDSISPSSVAAEVSSATDTEEAELTAQVSDIPSVAEPANTKMLLFFYETWDSLSIRMEEILEGVQLEALDLPLVKIDISENRALAVNYDAANPSTLLLIDESGSELGRAESAQRAEIDQLLLQLED